MVIVTVWIIMTVSTWSYEGVVHEGSWPNTKPATLYLSEGECERNKPVSDGILVDDETQADRVTFFECASMQLDAGQLKTLLK
jgi:hypothetical protein